MTSKPSPIEDNFEMKPMKSIGAMEDGDAMFSFGVLVNLGFTSILSCVDLKGENEYLGLGVSLGNVPMYHGTKLKVLDRKVRITELMLKCVSRSLRVVAIVLMVPWLHEIVLEYVIHADSCKKCV
ncbi:hypothetical protein JHK86_006177 [Glycine max]|nr:hypothetical protein JHK86_006177 [Glycine max]